MNAKQKNFILKKLIPFILREQGRGFGMDAWIVRQQPGTISEMDDVQRTVPVCGTMCCIGGSIQVLKSHKKAIATQTAGKYIGLNNNEAHGLFQDWQGLGDIGTDGHIYGWPPEFAYRYERAITPYRKAQVAVALLKEIVKTEGACLRRD